ncbi:MAG: ABC transporter substrate-binding protein [Burkholderiaceae bacterium]
MSDQPRSPAPASAPFGAKRRTLLKAGAALPALGFPGLLLAQTNTLKVGVILPLTGILAFPGKQTRHGCELGFRMMKERGINMEATYIDTESKPESGRIAAERLIRDGNTLLMGAWESGATISAAQAAEAAKVPLVVNIASAPQLTEQGFTMVFRNFTNASQLITNAVQRIKELPRTATFNPKTAVVTHTSDTFGQAMMGGVKALWDKLGVDIKIIDVISYDVRARDLSVEVAKAKALNPDLLCPITRVNDAILLVREMVKQDFNPMAIIGPGSPGPYEKAFTDALGKYSDDYLVCVPWYDPNKPTTKMVLPRWAKEYPGERLELNSGFGWEGVLVAADAFKRAGSTKPADLHTALKATNIEDHLMFGGPIQFDAKGQNENIGGAMLQIMKEEPVPVGPAQIAQAQPKLPMTKWKARG